VSPAPAISVIIPVFNRASLVGRAVASVLRQSFGDLELVIVDDGSADDLAGALARFADPRIRLIRHERNRGAAAARNTAIRASAAPYVALLDSDDEWLPEKLARQYADLAADRSGARLSLTGFYLERRPGRREPRPLLAAEDWYRRILAACDVSMGSCALVARSCFEALGVFDEAMRRFEDWDWLLRYAARYPVRALEPPLAVVHGRAGWPSAAAIEESTAILWSRHAAAAAARSPDAERLLRSTIDYERAVALYHEGRYAGAALAMLRALAGHPARRQDVLNRLARRRSAAAPTG
jgi:glycosyltransferase involved in cell wall biosynthesis